MIHAHVRFEDELGTWWSDAIRNAAALSALQRALKERRLAYGVYFDAESQEVAEGVLRWSRVQCDYTFGPAHRPELYCVRIARLVPAHSPAQPAVYGGFPLLTDVAGHDDGEHWRAAARRTSQQLSRGDAESPSSPSPGNWWQRLLAAVGSWLLGRPRLRVVSPEAAAVRGQGPGARSQSA